MHFALREEDLWPVPVGFRSLKAPAPSDCGSDAGGEDAASTAGRRPALQGRWGSAMRSRTGAGRC